MVKTCAATDCEEPFELRPSHPNQKFHNAQCRIREGNRKLPKVPRRRDPAYMAKHYQRWYVGGGAEKHRRYNSIRSRTLLTKAKAFDAMYEPVQTWWSLIKDALENRTELPEPPISEPIDIAS